MLLAETLAWLAIAATAWLLSFEFAGRDMLFRWGAEFWPRVVAGLMAALAVLHFAIRYREIRRGGSAAAASEPAAGGLSRKDAFKMAGTFGVPLVYAFLLPRLGYYVLTPFFISAVMFAFGVRRLGHLIGTTIGIYLVFLLVFSELLFVPLPTGYWPGFYGLNTAIVEFLGH